MASARVGRGRRGVAPGGGPGGMMTGRSAANLMTRVTMILGALFVGNSILLAIVAGVTQDGGSVFDDNRGGELTTEDLFGNQEEGGLELPDVDLDAPADDPDSTLAEEPADNDPSGDEPSDEPDIPGL